MSVVHAPTVPTLKDSSPVRTRAIAEGLPNPNIITASTPMLVNEET